MSSDRFYYRTDAPDVVKAVKAYFADRFELQGRGVKFAKMFGGGAMFTGWQYQFTGVAFRRDKPPKAEHLWTRPDKHGMRRPKANIPEGAALRAKWAKHWPKGVVSDADWLATLDLQCNPFMRYGVMVYGRKPVVYITAGQRLASIKLTEVLGSEYVDVERKAVA